MFSQSSSPKGHMPLTLLFSVKMWSLIQGRKKLQLCLSDPKQDIMDPAVSVMYSMLLCLLKELRQVETSSAAPPFLENLTVFCRNQLLTS